ncbi:ABC transporter permease subunit, partial [Acinetobacter baumannii]
LFLLRSGGWTLVLTVIAFFIGGVAGGLIAIIRLAESRILRMVAMVYILVIQSIPVLMVLFMSYYGLTFIGIELPPLVAASASLAVYVSA